MDEPDKELSKSGVPRVAYDELSLLYEVSKAMILAPMELDRLLHLILTCVTAGEALGFNRALLLLVNESQGILEGRMGVGPASWDEARRIWSEISQKKYTLEELLSLYQASPRGSSTFDEMCRAIKLPLDKSSGAVIEAVFEKKPAIVNPAIEGQRVPRPLVDLLGPNAFAVVPLVATDTAIGAIVAHNMDGRQPITKERLQLLSLLGSQAGLAIERAWMQQRRLDDESLMSMGRLAASVAHEVRNPLVAIGGFARAIEKDPTDPGSNVKRAQIIVREVERLERLVRETLDFVRPTQRAPAMTDFNQVVSEALLIMQPRLEQQGIILESVLAPDVGAVLLDVDRMRQVVTNLVENAMQSMRDGGKLTVTTAVLREHLRLEVIDTGVGIREEDIGRIFEPFFTTRYEGTGLGLAVTERIVREHSGHIHVASQPGAGTRFTVLLPLPSKGGSPYAEGSGC